MNYLETYLGELRANRTFGTAETSHYGALANLLNAIGKDLKPRVKCVIHPQSKGAGLPDGGFFTADQFQRTGEPLPGQLPVRGAMEVKPVSHNVKKLAESDQVGKYLKTYGQILVTNYRDFILVGRDGTQLESYSLAENEAAFWSTDAPQLVGKHSERFIEYLKRVMLHNAPLDKPADVAWFLASYARDAKARIEGAGLGALKVIRDALEEALGVRFEGEKGERFFRSTLVQTLFYGVFSAWVLWHKQNPKKKEFDWYSSARYLRVPILRKLFHLISEPGQMDELQLSETLDWAAAVLNRVNRAAFFASFNEGEAVQYFYEPFLEAFDPQLRKELGVWYTPSEIVQYMVARVDTVLRTELGIADGLADERVYVLDPCCGTGAYLVAVLKRIHQTLQERGGDALTANDLKKAATERVFGFEILPAPFVVAHLQLGLLLQTLDAPLADKANERAQVYLTNALTGWEPPKGPKKQLLFAEMEEERDAAETIKREKPILVVLGNPPYNGYAGLAVTEERALTDAYRTTKRAPAPEGQGLNDLYVRFFRMAERRIVELSQEGVVCFISNYSWLDGLSFTGMREKYLESFDRIWIDNLHGDRIISEYAPDGRTSETVFAVEGTSPGIKIGTAISLLVAKPHGVAQSIEAGLAALPPDVREVSDLPADAQKNEGLRPGGGIAPEEKDLLPGRAQPFRTSGGRAAEDVDAPVIYYSDWEQARAAERRAALLASLEAGNLETSYQKLAPVVELGLPFKPRLLDGTYLLWPLLPDLFPTSFPGVKTSRDDVVVDIDRERLMLRMETYFDRAVSHEEMRSLSPSAMENSARFSAENTRDALRKRGFLPENVVRYFYRPFDVRWLYWEPETKLLDEKRTEYFPNVFANNLWLTSTRRYRKEEFYQPQVTTCLADMNVIEANVQMFPLRIQAQQSSGLFADAEPTSPDADGFRFNLSEAAVSYLNTIGTLADAEHLFHHIIAILHAFAYRTENAGALRQDWPRVPLPATRAALLASAELGRQIAALLDTETPVPGVTNGTPRPELRTIADITRAGGGKLHPEDGDLDVTAGWGHGGKGGITMPGKGKLVLREARPEESFVVPPLGGRLQETNTPPEGGTANITCDVYLNDLAYWCNVPERVWEYTIGGYQVMKKWLSYRERALLGRGLTPGETGEVREVTQMARRIAAILLLEPELDENYRRVKEASYDWR